MGSYRNWYVLSEEEIMQYVVYELFVNKIFTLGNEVWSQEMGMPMGAFLSAALASITLIHKEQSIRMHESVMLMRYRDNILVAFPREFKDVYPPHMATFFSKLYSIPTTIEQTGSELNVLEFTLSFCPKKIRFETALFNKVVTLKRLTVDSRLVRFIDPFAPSARSVVRSIVLGAIHKCVRRASALPHIYWAICSYLMEFAMKPYPPSFIVSPLWALKGLIGAPNARLFSHIYASFLEDSELRKCRRVAFKRLDDFQEGPWTSVNPPDTGYRIPDTG
jgi:hypothetical protein